MKFRIALSVFLVSALCGASNAQIKFNTEIIFPSSVELSKLSIEYNDGFKIIPFNTNGKNNIIKISGICYSTHPVLIISYNPENNLPFYPKRYFLKPNSSLTYYKNSKNNLDSVELINAVDASNMGEKKFNEFAKKEKREFDRFLSINAKYINDSVSIYQKFIELSSLVQRKKLNFIKDNSKLYYSLWLFKEEFVSNTDYNADSLLKIYNQYFLSKFSSTFEAKQILSILNGRLNSFIGRPSPLFSSKDINGDMIDLSAFRGNKYVLLNFWATWCVPCVAEMPILDSIYRQYLNKEIVIISISQDRNREKCLKAIQKLKMNWINIINDPVVEGAYGNNPSLPQVYLIDKSGNIIYSRTEKEDYDLKKLLLLIQQL